MANTIVNRVGLVHPFELAEEEGTSLARVAAAFVIACELLGLDDMWEALDSAAIPEEARLLLFDQAALATRSHMADLLRASGAAAPSKTIADLRQSVDALEKDVDNLLAEDTREHATRIADELASIGASDDCARMVARLFATDGAIGLACLSRDTGIAPTTMARAFVDLGARLGLDWAQSVAAVMSPSDPWERLLVAGLARDFQQMRFDFLRGLARRKSAKEDPLGAIAEWADAREGAIRQFRAMVGRAQSVVPVAPAMLAQIASQARNVLQR